MWLELTADPGVYTLWNALMDATLGTQRINDRAKEFMVVDDKGNVTLTDGTVVTGPNGSQLNIADMSGAEDLANFVDFLKQQFGMETGSIPPAYSQLATIVQRLVNSCADLFNQLDWLGGSVAGGWQTGVNPGQIPGDDNNWPDDRVGTKGGSDASHPFTSVSRTPRFNRAMILKRDSL